jgi:hypothetical protein
MLFAADSYTTPASDPSLETTTSCMRSFDNLKHDKRPSCATSTPPTVLSTRLGAPPSAGICQIAPCASPGAAGEKYISELASGDQRGD